MSTIISISTSKSRKYWNCMILRLLYRKYWTYHSIGMTIGHTTLKMNRLQKSLRIALSSNIILLFPRNLWLPLMPNLERPNGSVCCHHRLWCKKTWRTLTWNICAWWSFTVFCFLPKENLWPQYDPKNKGQLFSP